MPTLLTATFIPTGAQNCDLGEVMTDFVKKFLRDEEGAVTVDWVVLTASIVAINIGLVMATINDGIEANSTYIGDQAANAAHQLP